MASGVFTAGFGLGEILGPILGSSFADIFGFREAFTYWSLVLIAYAIPLTLGFFVFKEKGTMI
jgi:MFS family permease